MAMAIFISFTLTEWDFSQNWYRLSDVFILKAVMYLSFCNMVEVGMALNS